MPQYSQGKIEALLEQGRLGLDNTLNAPDILALLTPYGFGATKLTEGQTLLQNLNDKHATQQRLYAHQQEASAAFKAAWEMASKTYMRHVQIARAVLAEQPERQTRLGLTGARAKAFGEWRLQAAQFYREALADTDLQTLLAAGGLTAQVLSDGQTTLTAAVQADSHHEAAKGLAQQSTQDRAEVAATFDKWLHGFWKIAQVALADHPQWLERLGRTVRS